MKKLLILMTLTWFSCQTQATPEEIIDLRCEVTEQYIKTNDSSSVKLSLELLEKLVKLYPTAKNIEKAKSLLKK